MIFFCVIYLFSILISIFFVWYFKNKKKILFMYYNKIYHLSFGIKIILSCIEYYKFKKKLMLYNIGDVVYVYERWYTSYSPESKTRESKSTVSSISIGNNMFLFNISGRSYYEYEISDISLNLSDEKWDISTGVVSLYNHRKRNVLNILK